MGCIRWRTLLVCSVHHPPPYASRTTLHQAADLSSTSGTCGSPQLRAPPDSSSVDQLTSLCTGPHPPIVSMLAAPFTACCTSPAPSLLTAASFSSSWDFWCPSLLRGPSDGLSAQFRPTQEQIWRAADDSMHDSLWFRGALLRQCVVMHWCSTAKAWHLQQGKPTDVGI